MDVVALTRRLVDIESITGNEGPVGDFLHGELCRWDSKHKNSRSKASVAMCSQLRRSIRSPTIVFSTHMDTVPPFIPSSEDAVASTDVAPAMPRESSRPRLQRPSGCIMKAFTSDFFFWSAKSGTAWGHKVANQQSSGLQVSGERRADREPGRSRVQGSAARGSDCRRTHGALGLSGVGRVGDRQAAGSFDAAARHEAARPTRASDHAR